jgi:hypothetical protein
MRYLIIWKGYIREGSIWNAINGRPNMVIWPIGIFLIGSKLLSVRSMTRTTEEEKGRGENIFSSFATII